MGTADVCHGVGHACFVASRYVAMLLAVWVQLVSSTETAGQSAERQRGPCVKVRLRGSSDPPLPSAYVLALWACLVVTGGSV